MVAAVKMRQPPSLYQLIPLLMISLLLQCCQGNVQPKSKRPADMVELKAKAIPLFRHLPGEQLAWGYEIFADQTLYIKQLWVPSLHGHMGFAMPGDALKAAGMVIAKLKKGQNPSLDSAEISAAGLRVLAVAVPPPPELKEPMAGK